MFRIPDEHILITNTGTTHLQWIYLRITVRSNEKETSENRGHNNTIASMYVDAGECKGR